MQRFFLTEKDITNNNEIILMGDNYRHIGLSLRMKVNDTLFVSDGKGIDYYCIINRITKDNILLKVIDIKINDSEPPYKVSVYQAMTKGDKLETVIQKSVEYGAYEIIPVLYERSISSINNLENKIIRWNKISHEAASQCGRGTIPNVISPISFSEAIKRSEDSDLKIICYEKENDISLKKLFSNINNIKRMSVFIGPEGGITDNEISIAKKNNVLPVSLGNRILRTESVAGYCLSVVSYLYE